MQSTLVDMQQAQQNLTGDSPLYSCKSGGIPVINTTSPYCVVHGGAQRMAVCCARLNNNGSTHVEFQPDCYPWCHVDLPEGFDHPVDLAQQRFASCLVEGHEGTSYPLLCSNPKDSQTSGATSGSLPSPTSTQSAVPSASSSAAGAKNVGSGLKVVLGVLVVGAAFQK